MSNEAASGGIGFGGALVLLFVGLKLTGYIQWSWWWVLAPFWLPVVVVLGFIVIVLLVATILSING